MSSTASDNTGTHPSAIDGNAAILTETPLKPSAPPRTRRRKAAKASGCASEPTVGSVQGSGPVTVPDVSLSASTGSADQGTAKMSAVARSHHQPTAKTKYKPSKKTEASGGKRKRGEAASESEVVQARSKKGKAAQTVGTVEAPPNKSGELRRVTCASTGAGKVVPQTNAPGCPAAANPMSREEVALHTVTNSAKPRRNVRPNLPDADAGGQLPTTARTKANKRAPKPRQTAVDEDPFETNEEDNISTADSSEHGVDATSTNDEEGRSDSEDGLDGDNVGAILTAEEPKWNNRATSATSKGKAVDKQGRTHQKRVPKAPVVHARRLMLDTIDDSSGSEFEPEEDRESDEEADVDEEDEEERQAWAEFLAARAVRTKNKAVPRPPTAREQVERPVWKAINTNVTAAPSTSTLPASTSAASKSAVPVSEAETAHTPGTVTAAHTFDHEEEDDEDGNHFGPDDSVIGGLVVDPTAPVPLAPPIPPIVVSLLPPALPLVHAPLPAPVPHPLPAVAPQPDIPTFLPPQAYTIVPNPAGGAPQLNPQHMHIVRTIRAAIPLLELYLATELAFPDSFVASQFISITLITSAASIGLTGLVARMRQTTDQDFLRVMVTLTKQRISTFRSAVKKNADAHVMAYYGLGLDPKKTQEKVTLLFEHLKYVYPFTEKDGQLSALWGKPYSHDCVTAVLRAAFATGANALISQHPEILTSTNPKRPHEREIPMVMLALVGTAIHAALSDWKLGTHKPTSFTADAYADVYNEHIALLQGIKKGSVNAYHKMMHALYNRATGAAAAAAVAAAPGTALAHVDIQGMDVDSD